MARDKRQTPDNREEQRMTEDYSFHDDLESIIADLPTEAPSPSAALQDDTPEETMTDTPEEALRKFREQHGYHEPAADGGSVPAPRRLRKKSEDDEPTKKRRFPFFRRKKKRKADNPAEDEDRPRGIFSRLSQKAFDRIRTLVLVLITLIFLGMLVLIGLSNFVDMSLLNIPESVVARVITPLQGAFSWATDSIAGYLRQVKLVTTLEEAYTQLREENERLVYQAMMAEEYAIQLSQFEDIYDEINANRAMDPVTATVIGKFDGNYFSTFTINKGKRDGLDTFMAVTISGALIGYTEEVRETESTVRTIIDSESSIAALIQSSRDQGVVKGTLGVNGEPLCRMYYLPDDNLPRPGDTVVTSGVGMSFPKGIPIGKVRESTRGMDANKQYVVIEPSVDFQHIEYVIVYRYKPRAEAIVGRENASSYIGYVPLETARPYPTLQLGSSAYFLTTSTPAPTPVYQSYSTLHPGGADQTVEPDVTPTQARATPSPTPRPSPTPADTSPVYEYQVPAFGPTPTPTASPSPSPTPFITFGPGDFTWEDD